MNPEGPELLGLLSGLADPRRRSAATAALARHLGGESLLLFTREPERDALLPAPGQQQGLGSDTAWRSFLGRCSAGGEHVDILPGPKGVPVRARGCAGPGGTTAVLLGDRSRPGATAGLRPLLPLLGALFRSERLAAAAEQRARSAAEEAERAGMAAATANRAKSDFLSNMSHELRTPINAVVGYSQLLEMEISGPVTEAQRTHLERIRVSSARLLGLVDDLLDLSAMEAGRMTVEHAHESVLSTLNESLPAVQVEAAERGIRIVDSCSGGGCSYVADPARVRQILTSLLSNAVKFTPPGGSVTVRCGTTRVAGDTRVSRPGPWTCVEVEDTGVGMAPEEVRRVFQPFVQAQGSRARSYGGAGLGLTISLHLARLMGGDLTVRTRKGEGSCFTLWLPAEAPAAGVLDPSIRVRPQPPVRPPGLGAANDVS